MYKSYLERGYYPLNATPIEKIIYAKKGTMVEIG